MLHAHFKDYLVGSEFRNAYKFCTIISKVILLGMILLVWLDLLLSDNFSFTKLVTVFGISFLVLWLFIRGAKTDRAMSSVCELNDCELSNTYMKKKYNIDVSGAFFVTLMPITFYYGRGNTTKEYYVFSKNITTFELEECYGVNAIETILREGGVLVPRESAVMHCCFANLKIADVPTYPDTVYVP